MRSKRFVAVGVVAVLVACAVFAMAHSLFAAEPMAPTERHQILVYLNGQQSFQMQGDAIPGYSGGTAVLPHLQGNGWRIVSIHLSQNSGSTGYALMEKN